MGLVRDRDVYKLVLLKCLPRDRKGGFVRSFDIATSRHSSRPQYRFTLPGVRPGVS